MSAEEYLSAQDLRGVLERARHVQRACPGTTPCATSGGCGYFHSVPRGTSWDTRFGSHLGPRDRAAFHVNASRVLETMANERAAPRGWHGILVRLCPDSVGSDAPRDARGVCGRKQGSENVHFGLAPALRVAVEQWRFLEKSLADAFGGEPETPRDAERCLETIFNSSSSSSSSRMPKEAGSGNAPELTIDDRTDFETCVREAMAAAATIGKETGAAAAAAAAARSPSRRVGTRGPSRASRACEAAARRARGGGGGGARLQVDD